MQAAKHDYCRCCNMILGKKYISLFGEKAVGEGIVDAVTREMSSEREIRRSLHVSVSL